MREKPVCNRKLRRPLRLPASLRQEKSHDLLLQQKTQFSRIQSYAAG